jgi:glycosyltransferase involved in cell wall biosynthesis
MPKVILLSQVALPFSKIGSWTTLYKNYLQADHFIDYIVCPEPEEKWDSVSYSFVLNDNLIKIKQKWTKNPYLGYIKALDRILVFNEKYVIQIVDNFGIVAPLVAFLKQKGLRDNCYLQFFYHGFAPFYGNFDSRWFYENIQEMVLLTQDSYLAHKKYYTVLPTRFSVLHNGIDNTKFFSLSQKDKQALKQNKGVADKKVFVWCAQDRPKKGLHLLLDAWKSVYEKRQDIVLWVIGCEAKAPQGGVVFLGRIPNDELAVYFQATDCYLFPTLCHEGFGLSLIEALHCGNHCIASALGGVPEVLQYGKLGKLIENPHFVSAWEEAILAFIENPVPEITFSPELYTSKSWILEMNSIINRAKKSMNV